MHDKHRQNGVEPGASATTEPPGLDRLTWWTPPRPRFPRRDFHLTHEPTKTFPPRTVFLAGLVEPTARLS